MIALKHKLIFLSLSPDHWFFFWREGSRCGEGGPSIYLIEFLMKRLLEKQHILNQKHCELSEQELTN